MPTPSELVGKLDMQRLLAEEIAKLDEALQTTFLLHHYEDWTAAEIAARTETPEGTVRWRLARAREVLRDRLDAHSGGDRSVWTRALVPWLAPHSASTEPGARPSDGSGAASTTTPAGASMPLLLAMSTTLKIALVATPIALTALGLSLYLGGGAVSRTPGTRSDADARAAPATTAIEAERDGPRARIGVPAQPAASKLTPGTAGEQGAAHTVARLRAVDESAQPIAGATVTLHGRSVVTDDAGRAEFEVRRPEHGAHFVVFSAGHARTRLTAHSLEAGAVVDLGDVVLPPGGGVRGTVVDAEGHPLAGAALDWRERDMLSVLVDEDAWRPSSGGLAITDDEGRFELLGLPLERGRVWAFFDDLSPTSSELVAISVGELVDAGELTLAPVQANEVLRGQVLAPDGTPVHPCMVRLRSRTLFRSTSLSATTDADGAFDVRVDPGLHYTVSAQPPDAAWNEARVSGARGGQVLELRFVEAPRFLLDVTNDRGEALERFTVTLEPEDADVPGRVASFEPDDVREVRALAGRFTLEVSAPLHASASFGPFDSAALPTVVACELRSVPGLSGRVRRHDGSPLVAAALELKRPARESVVQDGFPVRVEDAVVERAGVDDQGRFALTPDEPGEYRLFVVAEGCARIELPLTFDPRGGLDVGTLTLTPGGSLEGRVLAAPGETVAGTIVGLSRGDGYARTQRVGADGTFRFEHLTPGLWWLVEHDREVGPWGSSSQTSGFAPHAAPPSNVVVDEGRVTHADLDLAATPGLALDLTWGARNLSRATAKLTEMSPVSFTRSDDRPQMRLTAEGRGHVPVRRPGDYHLLIELGGDDPWNLLDELTLDTVDATWSLATETGRVDVTGLPVDDGRMRFLVWRWGTRTGLRPLTPDANGACTVVTAPSGELRVVVADRTTLSDDPNDWEVVRTFELAAGESVTVEL